MIQIGCGKNTADVLYLRAFTGGGGEGGAKDTQFHVPY
jgi:hypothetical protein